MDCEKNGEKFNLETFLKARTLCIQIVNEIVKSIPIGINEQETQNLIKAIFEKHNITKFWHPTKFRIGVDTIKSFRELSDNTLFTQKGTLCFVDVGPVIFEHEADYGCSFLVQDDTEMDLVKASYKIFEASKVAWFEKSLSGIDLYQYASCLAKTLGYELGPMMNGHRLGDFPHRIHSSQKLNEYSVYPNKNLWILEIHLIDKNNNQGAFFEDLLM